MSQSGRKKKERISPFVRHLEYGELEEKTEDDILEEEALSRMDKLEHTDLDPDAEYLKTIKDIKQLSPGRNDYSARDKLRAALAYTITASSLKASKLCGVGASTIRYWKREAKWWPLAVGYAIEARKEEWDAKLSEIISLAFDNTIGMLKTGEGRLVKKRNYKVSKQTGKGYYEEDFEIVNAPISAADTMKIASIARDKQALMRGEPTSISKKQISEVDRLEDLTEKIASAVAKATGGRVIEGLVIKKGMLDADAEDND